MTSYPCPACGSPATLATGCPRCGRPPDPDAAEVVRLDAEIAELVRRAEAARQTHLFTVELLGRARGERERAAARVRAARAAATAPRPPTAVPPGASTPLPWSGQPAASGPPAAGAGVRPGASAAETSTRSVQTVLFVLGGLLLGTAAIVFTAVAWASFGLGGRAAILAAVTAAALAAPVWARRRGLRGTAETFAAVASLLVLLDGYAARAVDLAGLAAVRADTYAGAVCVVAALLAAGYGAAAGLAAPRFAALLFAQPALPLLAGRLGLSAAGWAAVFVAVAALDLAVSGWRGRAGRPRPSGPAQPGPAQPGPAGPGRAEPGPAQPGPADQGRAEPGRDLPGRALRGIALELAQTAVLVAAVAALVAEVRAHRPGAAALAGGALLAVAGAQVAVARQRRGDWVRAVAGGLLVWAAAVALGRLAVTVTDAADQAALALVGLLLAVAVAGTGRWLTPPVRRGPRIAALALIGAGGVLTAVATLVAAVGTVLAAAPWLRAELSRPDRLLDWQLPVAVVLLTAAVAVLLPRPVRAEAALAGTGLLALAAPGSLAVPWWSPPAVDLAVGAGLAVAAVRARAPVPAAARALLAASLVGHAVLTGLARPASLAAVLGAVALLGAAVAALGAGPARADRPRSARIVGGSALALGLAVTPAAVAAALHAAGVVPWWLPRAALAAAGLLVAVLPVVRRAWPAYSGFLLVGICVAVAAVPVAPLLVPGQEPVDRYAAGAVLLIVAAAAASTRPGAGALRPPAALALVAGPGALAATLLLPTLAGTAWAVWAAPYEWLGAVWSGPPAGVGLTPNAAPGPAGVRVLPLLVVAAAGALAAVVWGPAGPARPRAAVLAAAPALALAAVAGPAAAGAPWPVTAAVSLGCGLAALVFAGLRRGGAAAPVAAGAGALFTGAGLAGAAATAPATIGALAATVLTGAAVGLRGHRPAARVAGWYAGTAFGGLLAYAGAAAAGLAVGWRGVLVVPVAGAALALAVWLRRRPEAGAVEVAAHLAATGALWLASAGGARYAAAVCALWGVAVDLTALWPQGRRVRLGVAAGLKLLGWWLLLADRDVALVEAYLMPAAAVALFVGWLARRHGATVGSWRAYGPALVTALGPSLGTVYLHDPHPVRRLLVAVAAVLVVLAGARWRLRAPVVAGGVALVLSAGYELIRLWDLMQRWIPLAAAGLLLVWVAMTLERRRRDAARLRDALRRMS